jgi:formate hydrogenlyase subunit 3/multisubunit Na+/H+ antiporter MnhD subunit
VIPQAFWLIALPIGAVPVVYLLRRVGTGAILAALVALLSAWWVTRLPTGVILNFLGRNVELDHLSQITLSLLFAATALLFLIPAFLPKAGPKNKSGVPTAGVSWSDNRTFYPVGLAILGLFGAASLSRHVGIIAILIEVAVILTVFVIQGVRVDSTRAALRFLVLLSLATPLFLLAAWRIDFYQLSGGLQTNGNLEQTALLIGFGFALWLAVVPFHSWLTTTSAEAAPATAAFVFIAFPIISFTTMIHLLADFPWLVDSPQVIQAIIMGGLATALLGGILAGVQRGFSELMGYAALYDLGCTLVAFGLGGPTGVITILVSLIVRALALTLIAASASAIRVRAGSDGFAELREMAQQMPIATIGLILGGLTLAGVPFTAGFAPHWQLLRLLAEVEPHGSVLVALAGLGVALGYLRGFRSTLLPRRFAKSSFKVAAARSAVVFTVQEPPLLLGLIMLLSATTILLGLFPAVLIEPVQALTAGISIPIR